MTFGAPDRLTITTQPVGGHATGAAFTTAPVVSVYDAYGNVVGDSAINVVASISSGTGGTLSGATVAASSGVANFSGLRLVGTPGTNYRLTFAASGVTPVVSTVFTVTHAPASQLVWVTQPLGGNMTGEDLAGQPVLQLKDQYGNIATSDSSSIITAHIASGAGGTISNVTATAAAGVVTFTHLQLVGTPGVSYKFNFTTASLTSADSNAITVTNNVATQIVLSRSAAGARAGVAFTTQPQITIKDAYGNVVQTGTGSGASVTAAISSGGALVGTATISATQGIATFADLGVGAVNGTYTITYTASLPASVTAAQSITTSYGNAHHLVMTTQPVGGKTGDVLTTQPVVTVVDIYGNRVEDSNASVTAALTTATVGDVVSGTTVSAVNGIATFTTLNVQTRPGSRTLTFSSNLLTPVVSASFTITHADASKLIITTQPVGGNATGDRLTTQPVIEIRDRFDNVATSNTDTINVAITSGVGGSLNTSRVVGETSIAAASGVASFGNIRLVGTPGTAYTLTFSTGSLTAAVANPLSVTYSTAYQLAIATQPVADKTGVAFTTQPVIQVLDYYGNLVANDNSTQVTAAISSGVGGTLTGNQTVTAVNGVVTYSGLALTGTPGVNYKLTFTSSPLVSVTSQNISVVAGNATQLRITLQPVGGITGKNLATQPVVEVLDVFGNRVLVDNASVITASVATGANGSVSGSVTATAVNGVATFAGLKLTGTPGVDYTLSFGSGVLASDTSSAIRVTHDAATTLVWVTQPVGGATGDDLPTQPKLKLVDQYGNLATTNNSTVVSVAIASGTNGSLSGGTTATAVGGYVQFSGLILIGTPGTPYTFTFSSTGIASATSTNVTVTHNVPSRLVVLTQPVGAISGQDLGTQPLIEVRDAYGNRATSDQSTVVTASIASGVGGSVSGNTTGTAVDGRVQFAGLKASGTPGTSYQLRFTSGSLTAATSAGSTLNFFSVQAYSSSALASSRPHSIVRV